ncbi:nuclear transport factor 2 family protein [Aquimarina sp. SS2-1]|uniref:nuclear transport factor 2 family protein n=1 Tax=Aquimarina besae TaxID=3342247 RepID=UPI00366F1B4C
MKKTIIILIFISILVIACNTERKKYEISGNQSNMIKEMIDAVNEKNPEKYVIGFAEDVKVFVESQMKVNGKIDLKNNRATHFENHPDVRSEIQHLVEIDNKVILHDKVWLDDSDKEGQDIVEIFTFKDEKIIRVDVIQPKDLFRN